MRAMKDSGIPWIGEIPEGWTNVYLKHYFAFEKGKNAALYTQEYIGENKGIFPVYSGQTENEGVMGRINTYDYDEPECLFTTTVGAKVMTPRVLQGKFSLSQNCLIMKSIKTTSVHFFYYGLSALFDYEKSLIPSHMQPSLRIEDLKKYKLFIPPLAEQQRIAEFLDRKCAEVDEMIALQEQIIEELRAYKQSVITEAVTKGLNPAALMKDSGIKWIRQIPYHWNIVAPKALFSQRKEKATEGQRQLTSSQQYGIIYQDEYCEITGNKVVTVIKDFDILKQVQAGDFVISMRSFQGGLEYSTKSGSISSAYVMLIPNLNYVYPRFYRWLFKSICYINALQSTSNMVRDGQAMRFANFVQVPLYQVPLKEQESIADFLDEKCADIDVLIETKQQKIDSLKEYKKSIIYEYVTGKREVNE